MNIRPLIGLAGAIFAAMTVEFNNRISSITLVDIRGEMGISVDSGYWVSSIYASANLDVLFVTSMSQPPLPRFPDDNQLRGSVFAIYGLSIQGSADARFMG